jgi:chloramphenicol O-acetyltransferase
MAEQPSDTVILDRIRELLIFMRENRPGDLSEASRLWSIAITDTERLLAFWMYIREDMRDYPDMRTDVRQEVARKEVIIDAPQ